MYLVLYLINLLIGTITTMFLWNWFISPLGITKIVLLHAFGIHLFINYTTMTITNSDIKEENNYDMNIKRILVIIVTTLLFLLMGYIAKSFM